MGVKEIISAGVGIAIIGVAGVWIWDRVGASRDRRDFMRVLSERTLRAIEPNVSAPGTQQPKTA